MPVDVGSQFGSPEISLAALMSERSGPQPTGERPWPTTTSGLAGPALRPAMPRCDVFVIYGLVAGKRLDRGGLLGLQNLCWRSPRTKPGWDGGENGDRKQGG